RQQYQRALDILHQLKGSQQLDALPVVVRFADLHARQGRCAEARALVLPAIRTFEHVYDGKHPQVAKALAVAARCDLQGGAPREAVRRGARAVAIWDARGSAPADRGALRFTLARALEAAGAQASRAREAALQAEKELASAGTLGRRDLVRVR